MGYNRMAFASFANVEERYSVSKQSFIWLITCQYLSTSVMALTLGGNGDMQKSINSSRRLGLLPTWTTWGTHSAAASTWPALLCCCKPGWSHMRLECNLWCIGNHLTTPSAAIIHQAWIIYLYFLTTSYYNLYSSSRYDSVFWPTKIFV